MRQVLYAMQFRGAAAPADGSGTVLKATTKGASCTIGSRVSGAGLDGRIEPADGEAAEFESEVRFTGETSFTESGTIRFGGAGSLRFSTVGSGHIGDSADGSVKHGCVGWRVDGGEGQFAGATGLITSNFTVDGAGQVTDNQFGVIFVA